ncbi:MAG TPA: FHA domain-containing protein [Candidatus Polarisedimenticolia bacterium]|nr:FHA domain-containing protein [Candidatus Polarisedimenticolia bacterium]
MPTNPMTGDAAARTADLSRRQPPFGAPYVYVLVVMDGDDPARVHRVARKETLVGRGEECHFSIDDEKVSRVHCKVVVDGPVCSLVDAGSRNGTTVNGRRVPPSVSQRLRHLDEIEIGSHKLLLLSGRSSQQKKGE